jgi:hypothetical protein
MTTVLVHGVECIPGCWVDGHWGQYGPDHLADKAEGIWTPESWADDPRQIRGIIDYIENTGYDKYPEVRNLVGAFWELATEATDKIEEFLNSGTPEGWVFHWSDGEFYLSPICDDEENCNDDTCAHWD